MGFRFRLWVISGMVDVMFAFGVYRCWVGVRVVFPCGYVFLRICVYDCVMV